MMPSDEAEPLSKQQIADLLEARAEQKVAGAISDQLAARLQTWGMIGLLAMTAISTVGLALWFLAVDRSLRGTDLGDCAVSVHTPTAKHTVDVACPGAE